MCIGGPISDLFFFQRKVWLPSFRHLNTLVYLRSIRDIRCRPPHVGPTASSCLSYRFIVWMFRSAEYL